MQQQHHEYDFLIVGGGMVADAAAKGIREQGATGTIGVLGEEPTEPFPRPALSKKLWTDDDYTFADAALQTELRTGAELHLNDAVVHVDPRSRCVLTRSGRDYDYGRLLLATGARPQQLAGLPPSERVIYYRGLADYHRLRALAARGEPVTVVGGGLIGTEISAALVHHHVPVTLLHRGSVLGGSTMPAELATEFEALFTGAGVDVRPGCWVSGGREEGGVVRLSLAGGGTHETGAVVVGIGVAPVSDYVAGVVDRDVDGAVVVDEGLRTSLPDVYAAGDVASYPDRILGRTRIEHVDNADHMGAVAGRVMAGSSETYQHTPMFFSDVLEHGYEAVGLLDPDLETFTDRVADDGAVAYYLDDTEVVGVLIWNHEGGIDVARDLLARHGRPADPATLRGTIR